jgi:hypothetical protein
VHAGPADTNDVYIINNPYSGYLSKYLGVSAILKPKGDSKERWTLIRRDNGKWLIKNDQGGYLSAQAGGVVWTNVYPAQAWEEWEIKKVRKGLVSIKGVHGK